MVPGSLPCRIRFHAEGVEAFIYNTTPAYDEIVRRMQKHEAAEAAGMTPGVSDTWSSSDGHDGLRNRSSVRRDQTKGSSQSSSNGQSAIRYCATLTSRSEGYFQRCLEVALDHRTGQDRAGSQLSP